MSDITASHLSAQHNQPSFTVSELSSAIKKTVEDAFGYVRVRGEISGFKPAPSGHLYFSLKDETAVIAAICWKGTSLKLNCKPEDGLEVICTGRLTTYAGQSKYQLIVEHIELAGLGALMALLEKRKQALAKEGLFEASRKKPLPFLPRVVGIVTSPTGAVIRDILHRLQDRFPVHVLLWPVLVQGEQAAKQISAAIDGFNQLTEDGPLPIPDVLIVARGGGSLEDLWAFNEEIVVRSAANSRIPLISAVGHETDTTLIDYAADVRAPTPTAAAEMAVPVRTELLLSTQELARRLVRSIYRMFEEEQKQLVLLGRALPSPGHLLNHAIQLLDELSLRFTASLPRLFEYRLQQLLTVSAKLQHPGNLLKAAILALQFSAQLLPKNMLHVVQEQEHQLTRIGNMLRAKEFMKECITLEETVTRYKDRTTKYMLYQLTHYEQQLRNLSGLLESYHYQKVLERGFALVRSEGKVLTSVTDTSSHMPVSIEFSDGIVEAVITDKESASVTTKKKKKAKAAALQQSFF